MLLEILCQQLRAHAPVQELNGDSALEQCEELLGVELLEDDLEDVAVESQYLQ